MIDRLLTRGTSLEGVPSEEESCDATGGQGCGREAGAGEALLDVMVGCQRQTARIVLRWEGDRFGQTHRSKGRVPRLLNREGDGYLFGDTRVDCGKGVEAIYEFL
jgi:hypothetical protein